MDFTPHAGTPARPRPLRFFEEARLEACGYALAIIYAVIFVHLYRAGSWILDLAGAPVYTDFATIWVAGIEAVRGEAVRLYDSAQFLKIQAQLLGTRPFFYPNWPYPPIMLLIAAPFGALPYLYAFLSWDILTLAALLIVVYRIVPRPSAIPLVLASPFTAWNFLAGQNGFLTGSLLGAALLCLQRRPVLAGIFMGCLSYKPQFGFLLPVALCGGRHWRAIALAAVTVIVGRVWRSSASYALKAAAVSAAALIATPYAFSYDMAALAIPVAFVARDQLRDGLLRREQAFLLALFGIVLTAFGAFWANQDNFDFGRMPLGLIALVTVMFLIMRRAAIPGFFQKRQWTYASGY